MKTIIITDSNCDLNEEYLNENMIPVIPFHLNMLNDGSLNVEDKVRGRKKSLRFIYEEYKKRVVNPEKQTIFIAHGDCREDAEYLKTLVMNGTNPKKIEINQLGPIIGSHTGPGAVVLTFMGEKREV